MRDRPHGLCRYGDSDTSRSCARSQAAQVTPLYVRPNDGNNCRAVDQSERWQMLGKRSYVGTIEKWSTANHGSRVQKRHAISGGGRCVAGIAVTVRLLGRLCCIRPGGFVFLCLPDCLPANTFPPVSWYPCQYPSLATAKTRMISPDQPGCGLRRRRMLSWH